MDNIMNWGSLVSSVLPTIGTVVGSLLGANKIEDGVVQYNHDSVVGSSEGFTSAFCNEKGKYYLFNQSTQTDDTVAMTFPARGQIGSETILIPGRQAFDVTSLFKENADNDNVQFELTACSASQQNKSSSGSQTQQGIKIASSGRQIPVGGEKQSIGTYFEAKAETQQITILPKNGVTINSLPMVTVQSGGETSMRIMDASGDGTSAVIQLPQPLVQNELISVEVLADVSTQSIPEMLKLQENDERMIQVDDAMAQRINNAPKLNWR